MPRSKQPKNITQGECWHYQFMLFCTTNLMNGDQSRMDMARAGRVKDLKDSCIDVSVSGKHDWATHRMKIDRMLALLIPDCHVGRHGTPVRDCIRAIRDSAVRYGASDTCQCKMYKKGSLIGIAVNGLQQIEQDVADDVRHDGNMIASNGGMTTVGEDSIVVEWQIMLPGELI